ncbi:MAG: hypothetical protein IJT31_03290 [Oscillibacter sp.]|nr:hypothetical protein [Oscillibacter sp.]
MNRAYKRIRAALACVLCAAALVFPARAARGAAYAVELPQAEAAADTDNGALFYEYLLRRAGVSNGAELLSDARSRLSERDKVLYDELKDFIVQVASGERTEAVLSVTYDGFPRTLTAQELGVSDAFSEQGEEAIAERFWGYYDTDKVFDALLADCPYELYWYKKDGGVTMIPNVSYGGTAEQVTFETVPGLTVEMSVSPDYGSGTTVNRALHEGIENIVSNATAIVNAYAARPDYEKLLGYATEICALVDYDDDAAENESTPYGDPWQLISVFDGDAATNVVCEGYAKAFKYLCDLSAFDSPDVECYLVTGYLPDGTGAGEHMWNLVTMDNGRSYFVDVTNSDEPMEPDYMFLKGAAPDSANPFSYTWYDDFTLIYDEETVNLWGRELLTLDTADYRPSEYAHEYEIRNVTTSAGGVTVELANHSGDGATLIVAAYAESGQFLRGATGSTTVAAGAADSVSLPLDTTGAHTVRAFLLDSATQRPFCTSTPYPVG